MKEPITKEDKNLQIKKEATATLILFIICLLWHVGFAYGLSGKTNLTLVGLPLWWIISVPGVFVVGVMGVVILLKTVFKNFDLEDHGGKL